MLEVNDYPGYLLEWWLNADFDKLAVAVFTSASDWNSGIS